MNKFQRADIFSKNICSATNQMIMKCFLSVCLDCGYIYQFMYVKPFLNFRDQTYLITLYVFLFCFLFVCFLWICCVQSASMQVFRWKALPADQQLHSFMAWQWFPKA